VLCPLLILKRGWTALAFSSFHVHSQEGTDEDRSHSHCLALGAAVALAQANAPANETPAKSADTSQSDGRSVSPETKGEKQPQGPTGPTETTSGGAPAPPGMQSAPDGSRKTVVDPEAAKKDPVAQSPTPSQPSAQASSAGIFENGVLTVTGADPDNQAAPAKFSTRRMRRISFRSLHMH
jgi:hypothetical protein